MNQVSITRLSCLFLLCFFWAGTSYLHGQSGNCQITGNVTPCQNSESEYILNFNAPGTFKVDWQVFGGSIITESNSAVTVGWPFSGSQQIIAIISGPGGTIASCNLTVNVMQGPVIPPLEDVISCTGEIVQVSTTDCAGCTYSWTTDGPLSIMPNDQSSANLSIGGSGTYCVEVTSAGGCVSSACGTVTMPPTQILPVTVIGATPTSPNHWEVCPNQPIAFSVDAPKGMSWVITEVGGMTTWLLSGTDISFVFPIPGATDYIVTATTTEGRYDDLVCLAIEPQYIHVSAFPPVPISCPSIVCEGDVVTYTVEGDGCSDDSMPWWEVSSQGEIVGIPTASTVMVMWSFDPENPNGYVVYNGNCPGYCSGPSVVEVPIIPSQGEISGPDGVCFLASILTWSAPNYVGGVYNWSYSPALEPYVEHLATAKPYEFRLRFLSGFQGPITIRLEFSHPFANCSFIAEKVIEYAPITTPIMGGSIICATDVDEAQTYTHDYNGNLHWTFNESGSLDDPILEGHTTSPHSFTILANTMEPGKTYQLVVTNDQGCSSSILVNALSPLEGEIVGPTTVCPDVEYHYTVFPPPISGETFVWSIVRNGITPPIIVNSTSVDLNWPAGTGSTLSVVRKYQGCTLLIGPIDITVLSGNEPLVIAGDPETCPDIIQSYSVTSVVGATYTWSITNPDGSPSNLGSIFSGQGSPNIEVQWLGVSMVTVVHLNVSTEFCGVVTNTTLVITINPFELSLNTPDICEGQAGNLITNVTSAQGYTVYLDGEFYSNTPMLNPIPHDDLSPGTHTVLLVVQDPNGCAGPVSATSTLVVHPNPIIKISLNDLLPCPKNTPFTRILSASPSSAACTYQWKLGPDVIEPNAPFVVIDQGGQYSVTATCGGCPERVANLDLDYDCDEGCCEQDVEGNDIAVQMTTCTLSINQCNLIEFSGTITPFQSAHNPHWIIEKPGGEFLFYPINGAVGNVVQGSYQATEVGIYRVYLSADELWKDIYIRVNLGHGQYIIFDNYCDFYDAGGPAVYPNYEVFKTNLPAYCTHTDYRNIQVPFLADFAYQILCNADGTFQVVAEDMSLYDTGISSMINWTYDNPSGSQSGPNLNIASVPALTNVEVCMQVTDQTGYTCKTCKYLTTPAQVSPGIDVVSQNLCQFQNFQFSPIIYPGGSAGSVVSYFWTFGDGTFSYAHAPYKVYTTPGTYIVELTVETTNGCFLTTSITVTVNDYSLPEGVIDVSLGNCSSSAVLSFNQSSGPPVADYLWNPDNGNLPSITVFSGGTYALVVTGSNGCSNAIDPVDVTLVEPFPNPVFINAYCEGAYMNFHGNLDFNYEWTWSPSTPGISQPVAGNALSLGGAPPATYLVTITAFQGGVPCKTYEFPVTVRPYPVTPQLIQSTVCTNGQMWVLLTATNVPANVEVSWSGPGLNVSGPSSVLVNNSGTYYVNFTNSVGCTKTTSILVENVINFSTFLTGCYDCHILENGPLYLPGIPGSFDSWYWEITSNPPVGNIYGTGTITPLLLDPSYTKIRLVVTQDGCTLYSDYFCLIGDCIESTCSIPPPTIRRVQCLDETNPDYPGMTRYFVHFDFPTDGIVKPCPSGPPDIYIGGNPMSVTVGQFETELFEFEEISGYWHFEGVFLLDAAYSPAEVCWGIPFCLIATDELCGIAQVCPVDYPNYDPYYSCTNPNGPFEECDDMIIKVTNVECETNPTTTITHLVTVHIEATVPPTTCGQYAIQITSITGDLLYPMSGQLYDLTGPTISTDVVLGWASNTANDILCLEVDLREDYDCWPLTFLDDPNTPNVNEAGKICLKRECFNLTEFDCPDHDPENEVIKEGITAVCDSRQSMNGQSVYNMTITTPFPIVQQGFALPPMSGTIQNINFPNSNTVTFTYVTVPGNLLFFARMMNNGTVYFFQYLLEDCGFLGGGQFENGNGNERNFDGAQTNPGQLELYPNPTNGLLNIRYGLGVKADQSVQIDIYDLNGRKVRHFESDDANGSWLTNVKDWNPGFYLVILRDASGKIFGSQKLIVEAKN